MEASGQIRSAADYIGEGIETGPTSISFSPGTIIYVLKKVILWNQRIYQIT